ncbi:MAG: TRAP dicarboxylate transporter, DctM subunit [Thermotoga petrophila]|uniref:TRAP dicarboxylate transporter, DctM subunit n=1 Tax=Thermotoga petrophila TaxID=93929 RepID=A0A117L2U2_9THEM|nr:MAG: TRAP dicarboxylate transporter, DctM subunit [Thermotoga petrophila]
MRYWPPTFISQGVWDLMKKMFWLAERGIEIFEVGGLFSIWIVFFVHVVGRYLFAAPLTFAEELGSLLLVWLAFLRSGLGVQSGLHMRIELFLKAFTFKERKFLNFLILALSLLYGFLLARYGFILARRLPNVLPVLGISIAWIYIPVFLCDVLVIVGLLKGLWEYGSFEVDLSSPSIRWRFLVLTLLFVLLALDVGTLLGLGSFADLPGNMRGTIVLFSTFFLLMIVGMSISLSLGFSAMLTALHLGIPLPVILQRFSSGASSVMLLAIPFFILAGQIMTEGGITEKIIEFSKILVGRIRGGLAMVNILASMFFGGVSGSSAADVSSIGSILIPAMVKEGYDRDFSIGVTVTSATLGIIIPPSHNMIIYSLAAGGVSIGALFMAGYIPGIMIGVAQMIAAYIISRRRNYPVMTERYTFKEALLSFRDSFLGLLVALIIIFGIAFGVFTATEASVIAATYALFVALLIYKGMRIRDIARISRISVSTSAMVLFLIANASAFGYLMAYLSVPKTVASVLVNITENKYLLMLLINGLLLVLGMVMDMAPLILIMTPILLPIVTKMGWSPIQFGIILLINLSIGLCTPPVGNTLFLGCAIGKAKVEEILGALWPFYLAMIVVLLLVTYIPWFTMFLGETFMKISG